MTSSRPIAYFTTLFPKLSESFVLNEVVELRRRGLDVRVVSFDSSRRLESKSHAHADETGAVYYAADGRPWRQLTALLWWTTRRPFGVVRLMKANWTEPVIRGDSRVARFANVLVSARAARRWDVRHIHAHWSYPSDVARLAQQLVTTSLSVTLHAHDIFEDLPLYATAGQSLSRRVQPLTFAITCTKYNQQIVQAGLDERQRSKVHSAYHGLDPAVFAPVYRPGAGPLMVASVGRLVPYKGFDLIVRAIGQLKASGVDARLVIAGSDGSLTPVVQRLVQELGLVEEVDLLGGVTQQEVVEILGRSDVFVNHSDPEGEYGVANVIVEAMSIGLPVVVTRRPQVEEYLDDGENGILVEHGDVDAVVDALAKLAADPGLRRRLGESARATVVDRFDIHRTVAPLHEFLASS